jgi:hypothetical protein
MRRSPKVRHSRHARGLELRDQHGADSIPIARHRRRGRFSPTGSFAYRTRENTAPMATRCAPRPPGKRLSALCIGVVAKLFIATQTGRWDEQKDRPKADLQVVVTPACVLTSASTRCGDPLDRIAVARPRNPDRPWQRTSSNL